jgi:hypothetical protein
MSELVYSPNFDPSNLAPYTGHDSLTFAGHTSHVVDQSTSRHYLQVTGDPFSTPYPNIEPDTILEDLLLPYANSSPEGSRYLELPNQQQYTTLESALHDIANAETDTFTAISTGEAHQKMTALFAKVGEQLTYLADGDDVAPARLEARQILLVTAEGSTEIRLLPPLVLQSTVNKEHHANTRDKIIRELFNSCLYTASSKAVRDILPATFKSFTDSYSLGRRNNQPARNEI